MLNIFKNKSQKVKLDKTTEEILNLQIKKKELELTIENVGFDLRNLKKRSEIEVEDLQRLTKLQIEDAKRENNYKIQEEKHKHNLELEAKLSEFKRDKTLWEKEKLELENKLKAEHDIRLLEATTLSVLDSQQKQKQAEIDFKRQLNDQALKHSQEISKLREELNQSYYDKLQDALTKMSTDGNANSRFIQDVMLKMLERPNLGAAQLQIEVNKTLSN